MPIDIERHDAIKHDLRILGIKFIDIATELLCPPSMVTMVSQGRRYSEQIERASACKLGRTPEEIWPERYSVIK